MKKITVISLALCLSLMAAGCSGNTNATPSDPVIISSGTETSATTTVETTQAAHTVTVEILSKTTLEDSAGEYSSVCPKLIVDGKEATEINESISSYIKTNYPLEKVDDYVEGYTTHYSWGFTGNMVSIVIYSGDVCEDYGTCEVFNYDLDTLKPLDDSEVVKRFGMTDDEFYSKTAEIITNYCSGISELDLDKSLAAISYDKVTPYVTPEGNPGVACCIIYADGSQFSGLETVRTFDM